ncbi:hypothetical protein OpiT1DRAFT_01516 [Opitutaceae bacterium TAV1]|nr:hypothetical protein OpiT1DRAFT_01516 [Opitutaceae bacterium TAV1]
MNPTSKINRKTPCAAALLLGLVTFFVSPLKAEPISIGYSGGGSSGNSGTPGIKLTLSAIADFSSSSSWELTSFTWLSQTSTGANPTGRGYILIFDAALFDPTDKTATVVNETTTGLVATSETWNATAGAYLFPTEVILDSSKTYYILNSGAITTSIAPAAPYNYGFNSSSSVAITGIQRWVVSGSWVSRDGVPNFSATFAPVPIPEPTTITALLGLAGLAVALFKRLR